jgi:hypothetical protein
MEVVNRLPAPTDPDAQDRLLESQRLLCASCVSEEDCEQAQTLLQQLASPLDEGGFDYYPALLTLASLSATGFEPAIEQDKPKAASLYLQFLAHEKSSELEYDLLEDAATALCNIIREGQSGFGAAEQAQLEELANGKSAGVVPFVATWTRFATHELERQIREANEDPKDKERRVAREAARDAWRKQELASQQKVAEDALARAEELQLEGNDLCRQGQLPGNAKGSILLAQALEIYGSAVDVLSECLAKGLTLVPDEANNVRRRRGTLQSNAAQVCLSRRDWRQAQQLAQAAMEDDPENSKSWFRRARAEIELREWTLAARTIDDALIRSRGRKGDDADANLLELWKLAEEVSKAMPDWKWSSSKPAKRSEEDFEKRLLGHWQYQSGKYEIEISPWGALIFKEENVKIDMMRKSKLSWRGEWEQIPGMYLKMSYDPGCDMVRTEFVPPDDMPEEQKWQGPTVFNAKRMAAPPKGPEPAEEEPPTPAAQEPSPPPRPAPVPPAPPPAPSTPDDAPRALWFSGHDELDGCYELLPEALQNDRPVYSRSEVVSDTSPAASGKLFLWYRGGNWGVTKSLQASSMAAPFLARCGDNLGRSRNPMDVRRPRWHVRKGRNQEDVAPNVSLTVDAPVTSVGKTGYPLGATAAADGDHSPVSTAATDSGSTTEVPADVGPPPASVEISGRVGAHEDVNGTYTLTPSSASGTPVYVHSERRLSLFLTAGYWVLAPELCAVPSALARCPSVAGVRSPLGCREPWEFLKGTNQIGHMVTIDTRTYVKDSAVLLRATRSSDEMPILAEAADAGQNAANDADIDEMD